VGWERCVLTYVTDWRSVLIVLTTANLPWTFRPACADRYCVRDGCEWGAHAHYCTHSLCPICTHSTKGDSARN
jgi:hypothetical protein